MMCEGKVKAKNGAMAVAACCLLACCWLRSAPSEGKGKLAK